VSALHPSADLPPDITVSQREFLERIMDERDRLYDMRFKAAETAVNTALAAQEKAVNAALAAQEKQTASSFMASEKAIVKAEDAQREYNVRSNEFRGQLDDQAKTLMPRPESLTMFRATEDKLASAKAELERTIESVRASFEKATGANADDIAGLRESRATGTGKDQGISTIWFALVGAVGLIVSILTIGGFFLSDFKQQPAPVPAQYIYSPPAPGTLVPTQPTPVPR
jgi:hypothetical protein